MKRNSRGEIRVMEAFLSALIIFSALAITAVLSPPATGGKGNSLANQGMQVLVQLDSNGKLGEIITAKNWTQLSNALRLLLPTGVAYNLTVYDENMQLLNDKPISNGNLLGNVVSINYLCAAQVQSFGVYEVHLQLAVVG